MKDYPNIILKLLLVLIGMILLCSLFKIGCNIVWGPIENYEQDHLQVQETIDNAKQIRTMRWNQVIQIQDSYGSYWETHED